MLSLFFIIFIAHVYFTFQFTIFLVQEEMDTISIRLHISNNVFRFLFAKLINNIRGFGLMELKYNTRMNEHTTVIWSDNGNMDRRQQKHNKVNSGAGSRIKVKVSLQSFAKW